MKRALKIAAAAGGGLAISVAAVVWAENRLWSHSTSKKVAALLASQASSDASTFSPEQLEGLPTPVARYFRFALSPNQPFIRAAKLEQKGEFRSGEFAAPWHPFHAVQHFVARPPGFVWDASIRMAPLLSVRVRDSYLHRAGGMQARLAGVVPLVNQNDHPALNTGALHRYLAEAVWFPTALLPNQNLVWESVDETTARATLSDGNTTVSLKFEFNAQGKIQRAFTPSRFRDVAGQAVPTPWACHYRNYSRISGLMVPTQGEVEWILPAGRLAYWRGHILKAEYEFGP